MLYWILKKTSKCSFSFGIAFKALLQQNCLHVAWHAAKSLQY